MKATVTKAFCSTGAFACPVAEVHYEYSVAGQHYTGKHERGFIWSSSAEQYVRQLAPGANLTVRLNPEDQAISTVLDRDQILPYTVDKHTL
ncbi:MAG TPA: hypothetical protein VMS96_00585 [Terriglobales bacterium]|nr:hypothetical protein [Terriglobales bacterium]